jgi:hypothetical protein
VLLGREGLLAHRIHRAEVDQKLRPGEKDMTEPKSRAPSAAYLPYEVTRSIMPVRELDPSRRPPASWERPGKHRMDKDHGERNPHAEKTPIP